MRPAADISRIAGPLTEIGPHNSFPPLIHKGIMETGLMAKKKTAAPTKAMTKTEILAALAEGTGLSKNEISSVFTELGTLIGKNLGKRGPGVFNIPGLMKVKVIRKPATKARKGINPFTKEEQMFKAKPARNVVKVLPLKGLKDMV
ncbi:HU family DNA-binding protein [Fuerstiella marisgermanici]|uniref:Viral histone-like protein n=1 Tax=Fuerstiella marisgermanici TaxID=1891926 RepID=A0A1P8WKP7_9PLAN|nr:HU family DNA-binding protein [Fuerstiella marisgermanici]APZ94629.1 Px [Fuerstiella marisgermanici]